MANKIISLTNLSEFKSKYDNLLNNKLTEKQEKLTAGTNITISGSTISAKDTTYSAATTSTAGLMSAADKTKLNGIATNANNYTLPTASASTLGGIKIGSGFTIADDGTLSNAYGGTADNVEWTGVLNRPFTSVSTDDFEYSGSSYTDYVLQIKSGKFADKTSTEESLSNLETKIGTKQDTLTSTQLAAVNSGITSAKVSTYDGYATTITSKQDKLTTNQLSAVNSGITSTKVSTYDGYATTIASKADSSTTYTKTEVNNLISNVKTASLVTVTEKPTTGNEGTIYLVGSEQPYQMWVYENDAWIDLGDTEVNLSNYYTKTQTDNLLNKKQNSLTTAQLNAVNSGITSAKVTNYDALVTTFGSDVVLATNSEIDALFA